MAGKSVNQQKYMYYRCVTTADRGEIGPCGCRPVQKQKLESQVLSQIAERILNCKMISELVKLTNEAIAQQQDYSGIKQETEADIKRLRTKIDRLLDAVENGLDNVKEVSSRINVFQRELTDKEKELQSILAMQYDQPAYVDEGDVMAYVEQLEQTLAQADAETARGILQDFIKRVEIHYPIVNVEFTLPLSSWHKEAKGLLYSVPDFLEDSIHCGRTRSRSGRCSD